VAFIVLPGSEQLPITLPTVRIGRDEANQLVIPDDPKVSRSHAELRNRDGQWLIVDLGSRNGTRVNGHRIEQHPLRNGDRIQLGATTIEFVDELDLHATEADTSAPQQGIPDLSERERQVLALIAKGLTDREAGERLSISTSTVRSHLDRIGDKTGFRRRAELTRLAMDLGILE
jgi:pSer/pThr/pTyr-binding forkhead associated (FHA) protein